MSNLPTEVVDPDPWSDIARVESWAGELRVNVIRLVGIIVFYGRHLIDFFAAPPDSPVRGAYHMNVTWICVLWATMAILVHTWLVRRWVPWWLKYATSLWDVILVTLVCSIAGGPRSPLVMLYFVILAMAPLRLDLRLVYVTTAAAMLSYLCLLGAYVREAGGFQKYYATPSIRIPRREEAIVLLALLATGFVVGQCIRQMRRIASGGAVAIATPGATGDAAP